VDFATASRNDALVITKMDTYVTISKKALIDDLHTGDEVIIFGEWQARPPKVSPNTKPKPGGRVKVWKNLPLKFSLTHSKQIVRTNPRESERWCYDDLRSR